MQQANHPRTLSAPSPNVSANMLLAMQSATTKNQRVNYAKYR